MPVTAGRGQGGVQSGVRNSQALSLGVKETYSGLVHCFQERK